MTVEPLPQADQYTGLEVLKGLASERSLLAALRIMNTNVGDAFQITLPRFQPAVFVGPEANRQILVSEREKLRWRSENDPVTKLLRRGVLVVDGDEHDHLRKLMEPALQRKYVPPYIDDMWISTNKVIRDWRDGEVRDMLIEMRKIALLILMQTLFAVDFAPEMNRMWHSILHILEYISPGFWIIWPDMPRPQYRQAIQQMDRYLYRIIRQRRRELSRLDQVKTKNDLLSQLVLAPGLTDDLIRDQLLTMLIAGHDTSTALLAWSLYLLGNHAHAMVQAHLEVEAILRNKDQPPDPDELNRLVYLDMVTKEALRLYPPIHVGNRITEQDLVIQGYHVPENTRLMCSIYLSHRNKAQWQEPQHFCPTRFDRQAGEKVPPLTYIPFGGGPRNCIGAAFAQIEVKVILSRLLQVFNFQLVNRNEIRPYMGATLEPRPGVKMRVWRRDRINGV